MSCKKKANQAREKTELQARTFNYFMVLWLVHMS